jgi:DNA-binding NarL/FixJ family response regulator
LTGRELEILAAIASGQTNAQIAKDLFLSAKTVMHHSTSIYRKLGVRGRAEAVALAYTSGLLQTNGQR